MKKILPVIYIVCYSAFVICICPSCKKLVEADLPIEKGTAEVIYSSANSSAAVMSGIYLKMGNPDFSVFGGEQGISIYAAAAADELTPTDNFSFLQVAYENNFS